LTPTPTSTEYYKALGLKFQGGVSVTGLFEAFFDPGNPILSLPCVYSILHSRTHLSPTPPEGGKEEDSTLWAKSCVSGYLNFIWECRESDYCDGGR
jgi:hypothetical protein